MKKCCNCKILLENGSKQQEVFGCFLQNFHIFSVVIAFFFSQHVELPLKLELEIIRTAVAL